MEALNLYFKQVKDIPTLSKAEERRLFDEMKKGSIEARNKLIESQLKLISHFVNKLKFGTDDFLNLIQICNEALLRGISKFNPDRGRLSTYVSLCVNSTIVDYHRKNKNINKEVYIEDCLEEVEQAAPIYPDAYSELSSNDVDYLLESLPAEDREVLNYSLGLNDEKMSMEAIGEKLGLDRNKVRKIKKNALKKLKLVINR